jgi:hypothetical protein
VQDRKARQLLRAPEIQLFFDLIGIGHGAGRGDDHDPGLFAARRANEFIENVVRNVPPSADDERAARQRHQKCHGGPVFVNVAGGAENEPGKNGNGTDQTLDQPKGLSHEASQSVDV